MSNIPKNLQQILKSEWRIFSTDCSYHAKSDDGTDKLLLQCKDSREIECVLMTEGQRRTVCISTQIGCAMGCVFCASGLRGVERNLTSGEMVEQVIRLRNLLPAGETVTHIVVMGMGESLANLDSLVAALDFLCSADTGLGLSQRRVTISTVGLPDKIRKLASLDRQYHLAVSLHAATEERRNELVPVNCQIGLKAVLDAADSYFRVTGRQVTYEYVMIRGINDGQQDARVLARLLQRRKAHVNLIPYNPVVDLPFQRPEPRTIQLFAEMLRTQRISTSIRNTKGQSIEAACGQLQRRLSSQSDRSMVPEVGVSLVTLDAP
jgi:23S rRNA (adenine2503-C2)-methyltransferase